MTVLVYLRFSLAGSADLEDFEGDMRAMAERAEEQPGHLWSEMGRSMTEPSTYLVTSAWIDVDAVRTWEHDNVHEQIQTKWQPMFNEPLIHQRFIPWERPLES